LNLNTHASLTKIAFFVSKIDTIVIRMWNASIYSESA
jgi:hypothetical protein